MAVPEAPVHKNHGPVLRQHEIRSPGNFAVVQAKAKPAGMEPTTDDQFGFGISAPDRSHIAAAGFLIVDVSQLCEPVRPPEPSG